MLLKNGNCSIWDFFHNVRSKLKGLRRRYRQRLTIPAPQKEATWPARTPPRQKRRAE